MSDSNQADNQASHQVTRQGNEQVAHQGDQQAQLAAHALARMAPLGGGGMPPITVLEPLEQQELLKWLRRLRAEVQELADILAKIGNGSTSLVQQSAYLAKTLDDLLLIKEQLLGNDMVEQIINIVEQMAFNPLLADPTAEITPQDQITYRTLLEGQIHKIEFLIGVLTIPERVNGWLANSRPGHYIPFHLVFEDEVRDAAERQRILNFLAWSPQVVKGGLVDAAKGLIYRFPDDRKAQWQSVGWLVGMLVGCLAAVVGMAYLYGAMQNPEVAAAEWWTVAQAYIPTFLIGWFAVLAGVLVHIGVDSVKREQSTNLPTVLPAGDLLMLASARSGQLMWKLVVALIGFAGIVFSLGVDDALIVSCFFVGYSLDSFVDLFGRNAESQVAQIQEKLK